jgi:ATP-dependent RNA helicase DOB1
MIMTEDLVNMKRVMRRLDLIDNNDVPHLKGKVAASISAADEILTTELIFSGFFQELKPAQMAAVLSCLVYTDNKSEGKPPKDEELGEPFKKLLETANKVATVMVESNIELNKEEYLQKYAPDMMEITLRWCQQAKFTEICELSDNIYEGTIIRALRRLDELISQLVEAAKIIGNNELRDKFMESQAHLKRGIVFTASLYL